MLDFTSGTVVAWDGGVMQLSFILAAVIALVFSAAPAMAFSESVR